MAAAAKPEGRTPPEFGLQAPRTLGIDPEWDLAETRQRFAAAGIVEKDIDHAARGNSAESAREWLEIIAIKGFIELEMPRIQDIIGREDGSFREWFRELPLGQMKKECLFFANALEKRADIQTVAVCFATVSRLDPEYRHPQFLIPGKERQFLAAAAFLQDGTSFLSMKGSLYVLHGEHFRGTDNAWPVRAGSPTRLLPNDYLFLGDAQAPQHPMTPTMQGLGVSAVLISVRSVGLAATYAELKEEAAKIREAEAIRERQRQ